MSTSVSVNSAPTTTQRRKKSTTRFWITIAGVILMLLAGFFVIRTQGHVSGVEFSPSHFQTREFSFYEIPLLHLQITPIVRQNQTVDTATYIRQKLLIPATTGPPDRWHLVNISRGLTGTTYADASFLVEQLQMQSGSESFWRQWSMDHPKQAAILWPVIQKLADRELCMLVPALLDIVSAAADDDDDPVNKNAATKTKSATSDSPKAAQQLQQLQELQQQIDVYLQRQYISLIRDMNAAGRDDLADSLLAEARMDFPQNDTLRAME